jgi:hypothetical protein
LLLKTKQNKTKNKTGALSRVTTSDARVRTKKECDSEDPTGALRGNWGPNPNSRATGSFLGPEEWSWESEDRSH